MFQIGDIVVANERSSITPGCIQQVVNVINDGEQIETTNINGTNKSTYPSNWFDAVDFHQASKFHIGDIVIGNKYAARYGITKPGVRCKVVNILPGRYFAGGLISDAITVLLLIDDFVPPNLEPQPYTVYSWCFDLETQPQPKIDDEFVSMMFD